MMRKFSYYFYENFDADALKGSEDNPRALCNGTANEALSFVLNFTPGSCGYDALCEKISRERTEALLNMGLLRKENRSIFLNCAVFTAEDLPVLKQCFHDDIFHMAELLDERRDSYTALVQKILNGFSPAENLYHLLCASVFDGSFFDYLSSAKVVSTSKIQPNGLDYLLTVYEDTPELNMFSNRLLCSYNRFTDGKRALVSFGDADGNRKDFYRFARQRELRTVPACLREIEELWSAADSPRFKETLLDSVEALALEGSCREDHRRLLELFGYVTGNRIVVPVFQKDSLAVMEELEELTEDLLGDAMKTALTGDAASRLLCAQHGVPSAEIANELYHIVFGKLNEELVSRGFVARPNSYPGEGRFLKSIELF